MPTEINGYSPSEETALSSLIINEVDSNETFEKMKDKGLLQDNQLYLVTDGGTDTITPESIGAAPASHASDTTIHVTAEEKAAWNDSDVFIATYGTTTSAEIETAYQDGKLVVCDYYGAIYTLNTRHRNVWHTFLSAAQDAIWTIDVKNNSWGEETEYKLPSSPKYITITLFASSWDSTTKTQTVTVTGVSATETAQMITPTPALASQTAYYDAGILCTRQAANSLTFTCKTVPTADLTVYVIIQEVGA